MYEEPLQTTTAKGFILPGMLQDFLARLAALKLEPGRRAIIAVSGGPDSVVLLDLLARGAAVHGIELMVAHVDHGIAANSGEAVQLVERLAGERGLRCLTGHLGLGPGTSETVAREQRYRWLEETRIRENADWVFTAHHAGDQIETVLLRLLHGSGPAGLAGMAARRDHIVRPLLGVDREDILRYREERTLPVWDDPANRDDRHLRSWVRTKLLPSIRRRLPAVDQALLQVALQAGQDRQAWDQVIDQLPGLNWRAEADGGSVAAGPLAGYDSPLGVVVLRAVGRRLGCRITREQAERVLQALRVSPSGACLELGNGWTVEIVFERAHFRSGPRAAVPRAVEWPLQVEGDAGDGDVGRWRLYWRYERTPEEQRRDGLTAWFIPETLSVRTWQPGDKVFPLGGRGRRLVVRCLQDARVPRRDRDAWPIVMDRTGEIVWVPGICRSNHLVPRAGAEALRVDAQVI